jgi:hypothetical protein
MLRWNPELSAAFNLTPLQFAALEFVSVVIWGTVAFVTWTLRRAKDREQRTPLKKFLMTMFLTAWVVGVLALFVYDKAASDATIKVMVHKLVEQY